jgi:hypothetical protein
MTLQSSGPISLSDIQAEFGGNSGLRSYWRGGPIVKGGLFPHVPPPPTNSTDPITIQEFYGARKAFLFTYTLDGPTSKDQQGVTSNGADGASPGAGGEPPGVNIGDDMTNTPGKPAFDPDPMFEVNFNLNDRLIAAGWDQVTPIIATININGVLGASSTGNYAFDVGVGSFNIGSSLTINVGPGAFITGCGAKGGAGGQTTGGPAINVGAADLAVYINNNGIIQSGGNAVVGEGKNGNDSGSGAGYYSFRGNAYGGVGSLNTGGYGGYNNAPKSHNGYSGGGPGGGTAINGWANVIYSGSGPVKGAKT